MDGVRQNPPDTVGLSGSRQTASPTSARTIRPPHHRHYADDNHYDFDRTADYNFARDCSRNNGAADYNFARDNRDADNCRAVTQSAILRRDYLMACSVPINAYTQPLPLLPASAVYVAVMFDPLVANLTDEVRSLSRQRFFTLIAD